MSADPIKTLRLPTLILYVLSFILPVGKDYFPGLRMFVTALIVGLGLLSPLTILIWSANPLLWWSLFATHEGQRGLAATLSLGAALASPFHSSILHSSISNRSMMFWSKVVPA